MPMPVVPIQELSLQRGYHKLPAMEQSKIKCLELADREADGAESAKW
jgi:hypothetical protein